MISISTYVRVSGSIQRTGSINMPLQLFVALLPDAIVVPRSRIIISSDLCSQPRENLSTINRIQGPSRPPAICSNIYSDQTKFHINSIPIEYFGGNFGHYIQGCISRASVNILLDTIRLGACCEPESIPYSNQTLDSIQAKLLNLHTSPI